MRISDQKSNIIERSHDRQIQDGLHDKILVWLCCQIETNPEFLKGLTNWKLDNKVHKEIAIESAIVSEGYGGRRDIKGFADLKVALKREVKRKWTTNAGEVRIDDDYDFQKIFIEVKSFVNLGETVRQINYYKQYTVGNWFVCAPTFANERLLKSQNIGFIEYIPEDFY